MITKEQVEEKCTELECDIFMDGPCFGSDFEDFKLPPPNWEITQKQLLEDYHPKVFKDILDGKIQYGKHEFGETDWIEPLKK